MPCLLFKFPCSKPNLFAFYPCLSAPHCMERDRSFFCSTTDCNLLLYCSSLARGRQFLKHSLLFSIKFGSIALRRSALELKSSVACLTDEVFRYSNVFWQRDDYDAANWTAVSRTNASPRHMRCGHLWTVPLDGWRCRVSFQLGCWCCRRRWDVVSRYRLRWL